MLTEDGKHLYVSYDEYHSLIEKLAIKVHQSGWEFDTILCLARGGMRPGDILSRIFDKPLAIMSTSSYRAEAGTVQGHLDIARYITTPKGEIAGKVLLVDDLADSGVTLNAVVELLRQNYMPITELRTAVIWTKGISKFTPDYSVEFLPTNPWIHQPFEAYDAMRPQQLLAKWKIWSRRCHREVGSLLWSGGGGVTGPSRRGTLHTGCPPAPGGRLLLYFRVEGT